MAFKRARISAAASAAAFAVSIGLSAFAAPGSAVAQESTTSTRTAESRQSGADRLWTLVRAGVPAPEGGVGGARLVSATIDDHVRRAAARGAEVSKADFKGAWDGYQVVTTTKDGGFRRLANGRLHPTKSETVGFTRDAKAGAASPSLSANATADFQGPNYAGATYHGGSCGYPSTTNSWGTAALCWWKYRSHDSSGSADWWPYIGATTAQPAKIPWASDPFVRYAASGSQMASHHRSTLGYRGFDDHWHRTGFSTSNCTDVNVSVSFAGASVGLGGVQICDSVESWTNASTGWKRMLFNAGFFGSNGADREVGHGSLSETGQRPYSSYVPNWNDIWWATFCRGDASNCI